MNFFNIILALYMKIKDIMNQSSKIGRLNESPYLIQIRESYGDIFIFVLIRSLLDHMTIRIQEMEETIKKLFSLLFEM